MYDKSEGSTSRTASTNRANEDFQSNNRDPLQYATAHNLKLNHKQELLTQIQTDQQKQHKIYKLKMLKQDKHLADQAKIQQDLEGKIKKLELRSQQ